MSILSRMRQRATMTYLLSHPEAEERYIAQRVAELQAADRKLPHGQWTLEQFEGADPFQVAAAAGAGQLHDLGIGAAPNYRGSGCVACDAAGRATCIEA